ncbi:MAG: hypothetical protein K9N23_04510 [Akkermansiaceae bacterium]|nr:hypothetical protein [Akkermansiaceae bacterium]MCF7730923.1 hypothetical protein [Akkermansiaceae bacterium]
MHASTLTIRLPEVQRTALKETALRLKKSESELVRELLVREFGQVSFGERAAEFVGSLTSATAHPAKPDSFRDAIKRNNRRPR